MVVSVSAAYEAELDRETGALMVYLISLNLTTGFRRFATWHHDVSFGGNTFFGLGPLASIDEIEASGESPLGEHAIAFFVQNDPDLLADLSQNCRGRFYTLRRVFLDDGGAVINAEAVTIAHRRMVPGIIRGGRGQYVCVLNTESRLHQHRNRAPRTYSEAWQLKRDATDHAFRDMGKQLELTRVNYRQKSGLS